MSLFQSTLFRDARILIGVTGGIAAYKCCELIRFCKEAGARVRVMMTQSARQFITPLTLETLSQNPVVTEMFPEGQFVATHHVHLADWAQVGMVAPATANIIGKLANGIADDFVSSTCLALSAPLILAPAMNSNMWQHFAVQKNVRLLEEQGVLICPPEEGFLAEGYTGIGRLARLEYLVQWLYRGLHPQPSSLKGKKVLITAGRTEEPLDPVRFLTNRSTGKMGFALAIEAFARGAQVYLVHGPTHLAIPRVNQAVSVTTAREMYQAVEELFPEMDYFFSAAAVADFRPASAASEKLKKHSAEWTLPLEANPDILSEMGKQKKPHQVLVGFAVETEKLEENALQKLKQKNLDAIVVNNPKVAGAGFATDTNQGTLFSRDGQRAEIPLSSKLDMARFIFDFLSGSERHT